MTSGGGIFVVLPKQRRRRRATVQHPERGEEVLVFLAGLRPNQQSTRSADRRGEMGTSRNGGTGASEGKRLGWQSPELLTAFTPGVRRFVAPSIGSSWTDTR